MQEFWVNICYSVHAIGLDVMYSPTDAGYPCGGSRLGNWATGPAPFTLFYHSDASAADKYHWL